MDGVRWRSSATASTAIVAQHDEHALPHRPLGRAQQRARLLLLRPQRRPTSCVDGRREPADPRDERPGPDRARDAASRTRSCGAATPSCTTRPTTATRTPADHSHARAGRRRRRACTASRCSPRRTRPTAATRSRRPTWPTARDVYEEGALIFPACPGPGGLRRHRRRPPHVPAAHPRARAVVGRLPRAARRGAHRRAAACSSSASEVGWDALDDVRRRVVRLQRAAAWATRSRALPAGARRRRSAAHDPFPGAPDGVADQGRRSRSTPTSGAIEVDLRDNPDCLPCGLNLTEATRAHRGDGRRSSTASAHDVPPERRQLPPHRRAAARELRRRHPARTRRAARSATTNLADRVANAGAARARRARPTASAWPRCGAGHPGRRPASSRAATRATAARRSSTRSSSVITGGAGTPATDGWLTIFHVGSGGHAAAATASRSTSCATRSASTRSA